MENNQLIEVLTKISDHYFAKQDFISAGQINRAIDVVNDYEGEGLFASAPSSKSTGLEWRLVTEEWQPSEDYFLIVKNGIDRPLSDAYRTTYRNSLKQHWIDNGFVVLVESPLVLEREEQGIHTCKVCGIFVFTPELDMCMNGHPVNQSPIK